MARDSSFRKKWASDPIQIESPPDSVIANGWVGGPQGRLPEARWENWWHNRVDEALAEIEARDALTWFAGVPYATGAVAWHGDAAWVSLVDNNTATPAEGQHWTRRRPPPRIAQEIGQSVTDVMSQKAVTDALGGSSDGSIPPGAVTAFAMQTPPAGWIKANGAILSRESYADLFAAIGTTFGAGNGSTTFQLPDLRGEFIRGWSDGKAVDSGRAFGSQQASGNASHSHSASATQGGAHTHSVSGSTGAGSPHSHQLFSRGDSQSGTGGNSIVAAGDGGVLSTTGSESAHTHTFSGTAGTAGSDHSHSVSVFSNGLNETTQGGGRPRNIALLYCIKY